MLKWLYRKIAPTKANKVFSDPQSQQDAKSAIQQAETEYNSIVANGEKVDDVVSKLRLQKERDHFGYLIEQTMRGGDRR